MSASGKANDCTDACCATPQIQNNEEPCAAGCCGGEDEVGDGEQDDCCKPTTPAGKGGCSQGCCSGNVEALIEVDQPGSAVSADRDDHGDGCCSGKGKAGPEAGDCDPVPDVCNTGCCSVEPEKSTAPQPCQDACCSSQGKEEPQDSGCKDSCCGSKEKEAKDDTRSPPAVIQKGTCEDKCCSTIKHDDIEPPCCEGKQKPCCDESCVDRLVLRESSNEAKQCKESISAPSRQTSIREQYTTRLATLGCLCRALIALGQESCCTSPELSSIERKRGKKKNLSRSSSLENTKPACKASKPSRPGSSKAGGCCEPGDKGCKASAPTVQNAEACSKGCCSGPKDEVLINLANQAKGGCGDTCCDEKADQKIQAFTTNYISKAAGSTGAKAADLEKGGSGSEHIVLSISGMTCTGCETKLQETLRKVAAVNNLKTSLIMARVELDLDLTQASSAEVMKHIERTTEFKCDLVTTRGSTLEVIPVEGVEQFTAQPMPMGVDKLERVDNTVARINFDPNVIGARDLIEKGFEAPLSLAPPQADPSLAAGSKHVRNVGWMTLFSAVMTIPVLVLAWAPLPERPIPYGSASLALATIVQVVVAGPFYPKALKSLIFSGVIEMDLLIVLSTTVAYIFSVVSFGYLVNGHPLSTGEFFETSTLLVTLIMVGRWVSALARQKAVESISIRSLQASTAILVSDDGTETDIDARLLQYGDVFKVIPEAQIPTDGVVLAGASEVNESMLTGESRPIEKAPGSTIIAGSLNGSGMMTARLTRLPSENTISTIAGMVDAAKLSKPKIQDLADRVASYFVPTIVSLTIVVFIIWVAVGIRVQGKAGSESVIQAITYAITVLIVSCPCAIGLAVPMVIVVSGGVAAERGLVFKTAESIEVAHKTSHVVFDKTGTLTQGALSVAFEKYPSQGREVVAPKILGLVADIKHPVSVAIARHLRDQGNSVAKVKDVKALPGKGVEGKVEDREIQAGNSRWLNLESNAIVLDVLSSGHTVFCVVIDSKVEAVFGLNDTIRADATSTIAGIQSRNISVSMLSGDDDGAVQATASSLGIPAENAISRCSPADKQAYIQKLLQSNTNHKATEPVVMFVGDGTNDAVALAQATIGVHVNSGTDVAQSAADVVLMRPALKGVLTMIDVSRAAVQRIAFNFGWSFVYNLFAILLSAGAFIAASGSARIPPEFAGLGELVSVLPVIVVALSLRWARL